MMKVKLGLTDVFGLMILGLLLFVRGTFAGDPGLGWHLKAGELMVQQKAVLTHDPFLFSTVGQPWVSNQWVSDILFYALYSVGGWPLLHVFAITLVLCAYFILPVLTLRRVEGAPADSGVGGGLGVFCVVSIVVFSGSLQWFLRPVLFSFLCFSLLLYLLNSSDAQVRHLKSFIQWPCVWQLPVLFFVWANLHPAFILGLFTLGLYAACLALEWGREIRVRVRSVGIVCVTFAICCLSTLLNPFSFDLYRDMFSLIGSEFFMNLNQEWLPPEFMSLFFSPFYFALAALIVLRFILMRAAVWTLFDWLLVLSFAALGFYGRRYIPFFALASVVPLFKLFVSLLQQRWRSHSKVWAALCRISTRESGRSKFAYTVFATGVAIVFTAAFGALPGKTAEYSDFIDTYPKAAVQEISEKLSGGRVFQTPDWGGYVTWRLWPRFKSFIDDRNQLLGEARYKEFFILNGAEEGWEEILTRYDFDVLLLKPKARLVKELEKDLNTWEMFYEDSIAVVFKRVRFPL